MAILKRGLLALLTGVVAIPALAQGPVRTPRVHAITNVRIWQGPGRVIERGTVVIRDGIIESVGSSVSVPGDARIWEGDSLTVYPGLIDLAMTIAGSDKKPNGEGRGAGGARAEAEKPVGLAHELSVVKPERVLADELSVKPSDREGRRAQGITTVQALPEQGAFRGQAAILNLGDGDLGKNLLRRSSGQIMAFSGARDYPNSTMGVVAVMRQTFSDTRWYEDAHAAYAAGPVGKERPPVNAAYEALIPALHGRTPILFVTRNVLDLLRAHEMGKEFGIGFDFVGSGEEYKRLNDVKGATGRLILPVNFPEAPAVDDPGRALDVTLEKLRAWDNAPTNPFQVNQAGISFAFTADGLNDVGAFRKNIGKAIEAGLPEEEALAAVTSVPASMIGMSDRLGTVDRGKIANLVVTDGDLFAEKTKVRSVWIDGTRYEVEEVKPPKGDPRGAWDLVAAAGSGETYPFTLTIGGETGALTGTFSMGEAEIPADITQSGSSVILSFPGDAIGIPGMIRFSFAFREDKAEGSGRTAAGDSFSVSGTRTEKPTAGETAGGEKQ